MKDGWEENVGQVSLQIVSTDEYLETRERWYRSHVARPRQNSD